jgi:hypothetical protein
MTRKSGTKIPGGRLAVVVVTATFTACNGGVELGRAPTTTAAPVTTTMTTAMAPSTTKATTRPRKATTTTTVHNRAPAPAVKELDAEDSEDIEDIEILPEHIEPLLVSPGPPFRRLSDNVFGSGPVDLDEAAADEVEEGDNVEEARQHLEGLGFIAGYSRAWEREHTDADSKPPRNHATTAFVTLYLYWTVESARTYVDDSLAELEESTDPEEMQEMNVGDVPGSQGWTGGNPDDGYTSIVLFAVDSVAVIVVCNSTTTYGTEHRYCANDISKLQYDHVTELIAS